MELRERIDHSIDSIKDEMKAMGLEIHANPELGLNEYKACALQVNLLRKYGFEVEEKYCGFDTAYKAGEDYAKVIDGPTKSDAKALRKSARQVNR